MDVSTMPGVPGIWPQGHVDDAGVIAFDRSEFEQSVPVRFAKVVARCADRTAITGNGRSLSYRELDQRSSEVAQAILARSRTGSSCVAYLVDHSPDMVICALAALKAGKAFLCIHPGIPLAGQQDIVADAAPELLLADAAHAQAARSLAGDELPVLLLDEVGGEPSDAAPAPAPTADTPAAIFYTSGSTGRPKGVYKDHRMVLHRAWLCARYDAIGIGDRQTLMTYCSFVSSEPDVFGALLNGAQLELYDVGSQGLIDFGAWIDRRRITLLNPPVVLFRRYLATLAGTGLHPSVRQLSLTGEAVIPSDIQGWRRHFSPACTFRNRLSSTEAGHIAVTCALPGEVPETGVLPAPLPVSDKLLSVVDDDDRPVAAGEPGELVVSSAYLSLGYWRRPKQSAASFLHDPERPGCRRYRTGDMGRMLPDGRFELMGRRDGQVKIRGYRVETSEIERALMTLPGIKEAAVIALPAAEESTLAGFVVMRDGALFVAEALRAELRPVMPRWKIPAQLYPLASLPLTLTGKYDRQLLRRQALAVPAAAAVVAEAPAPEQDATVAGLTAIWEDLLGRTGIGSAQDFFDLGGDSLMAVELMLRIERRFGRSLTLGALVPEATIAALARLLARPGQPASIATLRPGDGEVPLFCIPPASGSALAYRPLARLLAQDQPVHVVQFDGDGAGSFEDLAAHCALQLRLAWPAGPYRLCGHSFGGVLAYETARQLRAAGQAVDLLAIFDARPPGARRRLPMRQRLPLYLRRLAALGPSAAANDLVQRLRAQLSPVPDAPAEAARLAALRSYRPPAYPGVVTLFRAEIGPDWLELEVAPQPFNGWEAFCAEVRLHVIPGDHFSMMQEPNLGRLAGILGACLAEDPSPGPA